MNPSATASALPAPIHAPDERITCRMMVVYEDRPTLQRALDMCSRIKGGLDGELNFEISQWQIAELETRSSRDAAAEGAAGAQVIVFSSHAALVPSQNFRQWADSWLPKASASDIAVVALLDADAGETRSDNAMCEFLETAATAHGVDFFAELERSSGCHNGRTQLHQT